MFVGAILVGLLMGFTSCDEIFGDADPAPIFPELPTAPIASVTVAPTVTAGTITAGSTTAIVTVATVDGGTMMYKVTITNTKPSSTEGFTATVPTAAGLEPGTYYVWYYVKGDATHSDSDICATAIEVTVYSEMLTTPLTFEAKTAGAVITFKENHAATGSAKDIEYSTDGGTTWTAGNTGGTGVSVTLTNVGDKVMFRGTNATYCVVGVGNYNNRFSCTEDCYIYGNIMSLINKDNFATNKEFTEKNALSHMFYNNTHIINHDTKTLELPATTLTQGCYWEMFDGCTGLTTAPKLPATTLADGCYQQMFEKCTALAAAPELPATTLKGACYYEMFVGCTALTTAPALPATTLAVRCYSEMFEGCTALTAAPTLSATTLADYCYALMFANCSDLTTAPELPATTLAERCYWGMFGNCTALTAAPALPATTLKDYCYDSMFYGCTNLIETPKLPATTLVDYCYNLMFYNCTSLTKAWVKADYTVANNECTDMFKGCTNAATSTFYSDYAGNWMTAFPTVLSNWVTAAYPTAP